MSSTAKPLPEHSTAGAMTFHAAATISSASSEGGPSLADANAGPRRDEAVERQTAQKSSRIRYLDSSICSPGLPPSRSRGIFFGWLSAPSVRCLLTYLSCHCCQQLLISYTYCPLSGR